MPLPYWFYSGRTTTPISYKDENGNLVSEILVPRRLFHAPQAAVSHLLRLKPPRVKRMPDPTEKPESKVKKFAKKAALPSPKSAVEEKSDSSEPESSDDVISSKAEEGVGESKPVEKEKVEPPPRRTRRRQQEVK